MAAQVTQTWNHSLPSETDQQYDLQLLTICGISVLGRWAGAFGEHYVGWAKSLNQPLYIPNHNQQKEHNYAII